MVAAVAARGVGPQDLVEPWWCSPDVKGSLQLQQAPHKRHASHTITKPQVCSTCWVERAMSCVQCLGCNRPRRPPLLSREPIAGSLLVAHERKKKCVKTPGKGPVTWPGREPLARKGWGGHPRVSPVRVLQATRQVLCMCAPKSARRKVSRGPSFFRLIRPWNKRPCPQVASLAAPRTRSETSRAVHHPVPSPTP